jgi:hypothetical protein
MSKNKITFRILALFLLFGTIPLVIGAPPSASPNDGNISSSDGNISSVPNGNYSTTISAVYSSSTQDDNWAYVDNKSVTGESIGWLQLTPSSGVQNANMLTILNSAFLNKKKVWIYIADNNLSAVSYEVENKNI